MLGLVPRNEKNITIYLDFIAKQIAKYNPSGPGLLLHDPITAEIRARYVMLLANVNDTPALAKGNRQNGAGSKVRACSDCAIEGKHMKSYHTVKYPGCGRFLPPAEEKLRARYKACMEKSPETHHVAALMDRRPRAITDDFARLAMQAGDLEVLHDKHERHVRHTLGYRGTDVFSKHLSYFRPWMCHRKDTAHMVLNSMRQVLDLWANRSKMKIASRNRGVEGNIPMCNPGRGEA